MLDTIWVMTPAIIVLILFGALTLGLGWWASLIAEGKDEWVLGDDEENHQ